MLLSFPGGTSARREVAAIAGSPPVVTFTAALDEVPTADPRDVAWRLYDADADPLEVRIVAVEPVSEERVRISAIDEVPEYTPTPSAGPSYIRVAATGRHVWSGPATAALVWLVSGQSGDGGRGGRGGADGDGVGRGDSGASGGDGGAGSSYSVIRYEQSNDPSDGLRPVRYRVWRGGSGGGGGGGGAGGAGGATTLTFGGATWTSGAPSGGAGAPGGGGGGFRPGAGGRGGAGSTANHRLGTIAIHVAQITGLTPGAHLDFSIGVSGGAGAVGGNGEDGRGAHGTPPGTPGAAGSGPAGYAIILPI